LRIGILGGGQLARMLALAGHPLGVETAFLDPKAQACAAPAARQIQGAYDDADRVRELADGAAAVTYDLEAVPEATIDLLGELPAVHPNPAALATTRDRLREKTLFREQGIPTAPFAAVDSQADLEAAVADIGLPAVLKTRSFGYDGKGQKVLRERADLEGACAELGNAPLLLEGMVAFQREVSVIAVRGRDGATAFYPLAENDHRDSILHVSVSRPGDPFQAQAEDCIAPLLEAMDYVGVLALELFQAGDALLANEMAPRVHNSGHWTIEGAETSQFENHLRAITGLPLGSTEPVGLAGMVNFVGDMPDPTAVLAQPHAHLHDYGKAPRPGRKLGHATVRADSEQSRQQGLQALRPLAG
jgi:5-(carboxyamino)imidazole ribonucleotide synthase